MVSALALVTYILDGNQWAGYPPDRECGGVCHGNGSSGPVPRLRRHPPTAVARVVTDPRRGGGTRPQAGGEFWRSRSSVRGFANCSGSGGSACGGGAEHFAG